VNIIALRKRSVLKSIEGALGNVTNSAATLADGVVGFAQGIARAR
jgi:hypothetical protein